MISLLPLEQRCHKKAEAECEVSRYSSDNEKCDANSVAWHTSHPVTASYEGMVCEWAHNDFIPSPYLIFMFYFLHFGHINI